MTYAPTGIALGDSIVLGVGDNAPDFGFRGPLYNKAAAAGTPFFFLGSQASGNGVDPYHDGIAGARLADITAIAAARMATYEPDIALLEGGTNNIGLDGATPAQVASFWSTLLDTVWGARTKRWFRIVALNILRRTDGFDVAPANAAVAAMIAAKSYVASIRICDWYNCLLDSDYVDGLHPNAGGYAKAGPVIYAAGWSDAIAGVVSSPLRS